MDSMELDYDSPGPSIVPAVRAPAPGVSNHAAGIAAQRESSTTTARTYILNGTGSLNAAAADKQANAASRILDELLGDMLAIVEDDSEESSDNEGERGGDNESDSWSSDTSSSSSSSKQPSKQAPPNARNSNAPDADEREEGELESDHEQEQRRLLQAKQQAERDAKRRRREEREKKSIVRNVSERDVFRYLKCRGFPNTLLNDFVKACLSQSSTPVSATQSSEQNQEASTSTHTDNPTTASNEAAQPSKADLLKLSNKHSYKHLLNKANKAKEGQIAIGNVLNTCMRIVAEEEHAKSIQRQQQEQSDLETSRLKAKERDASLLLTSVGEKKQKGSYTGRKRGVDKSTETDPLPLPPSTLPANSSTASTSASVQGSKEVQAGQFTSDTKNTRLPTPTSPIPSTSNTSPAPQASRTDNTRNRERSAKAAKLASQFKQALDSKYLTLTKKQWEFATIVKQIGRNFEEMARDAKQSSSSTMAITKQQSQSQPMSVDTPSVQAHLPNSNNGVKGAAPSVSSSHTSEQPSASIYELVPEYILQKKKTSQADTDDLPRNDDGRMDVDFVPSVEQANGVMQASASKEAQATSGQSSAPEATQQTDKSKSSAREEPTKDANKEDGKGWFGDLRPDDGTYSPLEMDVSPLPTAHPGVVGSNQQHTSTGLPPEPVARAVRTSMSPPPPAGARRVSAGSPPVLSNSTSASTLPPRPSHLPAKPSMDGTSSLALPSAPAAALPSNTSTSKSGPIPLPFKPIDPKVRDAMFVQRKPPSSTSAPIRKPPPGHVPGQQPHYSDILSSNESVPLPRKEIKRIDPRKAAAEKAKMLREERESESDRAGSPSIAVPPHKQTQTQPQQSIYLASTALQPQKTDVMESSASPDVPTVPVAEQDIEAKHPTPPKTKSTAQAADNAPRQATDASLPLPSFKKNVQTFEKALLGELREEDYTNKLKRSREEAGSSAIESSNKRPARESSAPSAKVDSTTEPAKSAPTSTRKLVNAQGRRMSNVHRDEDYSSDTDEDDPIAVPPIKMALLAAGKKKFLPTVDVESQASRQNSVESGNTREGSVDSRTGSVSGTGKGKIVARKSTGGYKKKLTAPAATPVASGASALSAPLSGEGLKVTLKLSGSKSTSEASQQPTSATSSSSRLAAVSAPTISTKPVAKKTSSTVIEIDDSSDDDDDDDNIPLRKAPSTAKKAIPSSNPASATMTPTSSATSASGSKPRPRAKPLVGSGKRLSDIGVAYTPPKARGSSTEDDLALPGPSASQKPSSADTSLSKSKESRSSRDPIRLGTLPLRALSPATPVEDANEAATIAKPKSPTPNRDNTARSPQMAQYQRSASPVSAARDSEDVIPDSDSERYSPSAIPRYSMSPVPDDATFNLPSTRISPPAARMSGSPVTARQAGSPAYDSRDQSVPQVDATLALPEARMTVASSQSPEESQALRTGSAAAFDEDVDMLASDTEDNAIADELLKDTLDDLPDIAQATTSVIQTEQATAQESKTSLKGSGHSTQTASTVAKTIDKGIQHLDSMAESTQRNFMDPMDLSHAFGSDQEDAEGESDTLHENPQSSMISEKMQTAETRQKNHNSERDNSLKTRTALSHNTSLARALSEDQDTDISKPMTAHVSMPPTQASTTSFAAQGHSRASASDIQPPRWSPPAMVMPSSTTNPIDRTPIMQSAGLPSQFTSGLTRSGSASQTSPQVPASEPESFEIIMEDQSPAGKLVPPGLDENTESARRTQSILAALNRPLEQAPVRCRYGTACLDMNCSFAHPCPSLSGAESAFANVPTSRKDCIDGIYCVLKTCPFSHPSPAARRKAICPNQANCPYGAKCLFRHADQSNSQIAQRYSGYNQTARFNTPTVAPAPAPAPTPGPQPVTKQHTSPPPTLVPDVAHRLPPTSSVSPSILPFYSHPPMPAIPTSSASQSRSASPAVNTLTGSKAGSPPVDRELAQNGRSQMRNVYSPTFHYQQQQNQQQQQHQQQQNAQHQSMNRSWTSGATGWLANLTGLSKPSQNQ